MNVAEAVVNNDKRICDLFFFFFSSRRRHTRLTCDWSSDVCSSDLVRTRLVERLSRGDVVRDLLAREPPKRHVGHVERVLQPPVVRHGDGREDLMFAPLQPAQHVGRLVRARGLREHAPAQHHGRVGREHHGPVLLSRHRARLLACETRDVALGLLRGTERLVHVRRHHPERNAEHFEELAAPRAATREDDHFSRISVTGPSFTNSTSIIAPNSPVSTFVPLPAPRSRSNATNRSYSGVAISGAAASTKLGRRPFCTSPYRVN